MPQQYNYDDLERDVRGAYARVSTSEDRKQSTVATLQKLARAFLKWDDDADKKVRRELQNFADMSLTEEATSWYSEQAMRDCFVRALVSAADNDESRPEKSDGDYMGSDAADEWAENYKVRAAFCLAMKSAGTLANDSAIQAALAAVKK